MHVFYSRQYAEHDLLTNSLDQSCLPNRSKTSWMYPLVRNIDISLTDVVLRIAEDSEEQIQPAQ